jgi:Protein of unknown function (DUF1353)
MESASESGRYIGTVKAKWLDDGRRMRLLAKFSYIDPKGLRWDAPKGWVIDGASIPRVLWTPVGGPFEGIYRNASVIHDVGCDQRTRPWEAVHEVFYWAMLTSGVGILRAKIMYAAVYHFGPRWPQKILFPNLSNKGKSFVMKESSIKPRSTTKISISRKCSTSNEHPEEGSFAILIAPPQSQFTEGDFESLKEVISNQESPNDSQGFSLEEIRNLQPETLLKH